MRFTLFAVILTLGVATALPVQGQIQTDPELAASRLMVRAMTRAFLGDDDGALTLMEQVLRYRPDDPTVHAAMAQAYVRMNDPAQASFYAERALLLAPNRPENLRLAAELRELGFDAVGAQAAWRELLALRPDDVSARVSLARLLMSLEQRTAARDEYRRVDELGPQPVEILEEYLVVLMALGDLEDALEVATRVVRREPTVDRFMARGEILVRLDRGREAADAFHEALRRSPGNEDAFAALQALDPDRAAAVSSGGPVMDLAALTAAAEADVRNVGLRLDALDANLAARDLVVSMRLAEDGLLFFPGNSALLERAVDVFLHALDPDRAVELLASPDVESAAAGRAAAERVRGGEPRAVAVPDSPRGRAWAGLAGAGIDIVVLPENPSSALARALFVADARGAGQAADFLQAQLAERSASPLELVFLGDLLEQAGRRADAVQAWRRALDSAPSNPIVLTRLQ